MLLRVSEMSFHCEPKATGVLLRVWHWDAGWKDYFFLGKWLLCLRMGECGAGRVLLWSREVTPLLIFVVFVSFRAVRDVDMGE